MSPFVPDEEKLEIERIRRMADAWRGLRPDPRETAAARARFEARRNARRRLRIAPGGVVLAALFVAAAASGASRLATIVSRLTRAATAESADAPAAASAPPRRAPLRPEAAGPMEGSTATPEPRSTPALDPLAAPRGSTTPQGPVLSPHGDATPRRRHVAATGTEGIAATSSRPGTPTSSAWEVAAAALRIGDAETAERAFGSLAESPDPRTRDAARLARAQLWLSRGRVAEARGELGSLARRGATSLVRARAAEALDDLP